MTLIKHCASWMRTKIGLLVVVGLMGGIIALERSVGSALLVGATPLVMVLACLVPCAIPLLLLRRRKQPSTPSTEAISGACSCGNVTCQTASTTPTAD